MGANRKLQAEIDRTLKKVAEGIDTFDQIWEKVYDVDNSETQKEKYEADLKKEIKKLQRYRDQIKTWVSNSDIKDTNDLVAARKKVERQMERFKVCERETKTKAFSKEGLGQAMKLDPKEKARNEIRGWINVTVEKLAEEVENFDAEIEQLGTLKKKAKPPPRAGHLEESVTRHKAHITRLEQMLRLLDNEQLNPEDIEEVKDMVDDYLDRNQESFSEFETPDDLYAGLIEQLDSLEAQLPVAAVTHVKAKDPKEKEKEKERERERERQAERERAAAHQAKLQLASSGIAHVRLEEVETDRPGLPMLPVLPRKASDPSATAKGKDPPTPTGPLPTPAASPSKPIDGPNMAIDVPGQLAAPSSTSMPHAPVQSPRHEPAHHTQQPSKGDQPAAQASGPPAQQTQQTRSTPISTAVSGVASPAPGPTGTPRASGPGWTFSSTDSEAFPQLGQGLSIPPPQQQEQGSAAVPGTQRLQELQPNGGSLLGQSPGAGSGPFAAAAAGPPGLGYMLGRPAESAQAGNAKDRQQPMRSQSQASSDTAGEGPAAGMQQAPVRASGMADMGPAAGDLPGLGGTPLEAQPLPPVAPPAESLKILQACANRSIPQHTDSGWASGQRPRSVAAPPSYPVTKLPILDSPILFEKLDTEALFFAFYYQPGTLQQYLAARELKRQSWRYHKQHGAWFQRHEEPKVANEEYEQGTYVYFDYNIMHDEVQTGWCYRLKQDFVFKYDALEDELQPN